MVEEWLTWIYRHKKPLIWFLILVVLPFSCTLYLIKDLFLPEIPWKTGISYDVGLFSADSKEKRAIDIIALYKGKYERGNVYGVQSALFNKKLVHAIEDRAQIEHFLNLVSSSCKEECPEYRGFWRTEGTTEIDVITFDYTHNYAGYFTMYLVPAEKRYLTVFYVPDLLVAYSNEMSAFLNDLGITPE